MATILPKRLRELYDERALEQEDRATDSTTLDQLEKKFPKVSTTSNRLRGSALASISATNASPGWKSSSVRRKPDTQLPSRCRLAKATGKRSRTCTVRQSLDTLSARSSSPRRLHCSET